MANYKAGHCTSKTGQHWIIKLPAALTKQATDNTDRLVKVATCTKEKEAVNNDFLELRSSKLFIENDQNNCSLKMIKILL